MNLIHTLPNWLLIAGIVLAPLVWAFIGRSVSAAKAESWRLVNKVVFAIWLVLVIYGGLLCRLDMDLTGLSSGIAPFSNLDWNALDEICLNILMFEPIGMTLTALLKPSKARIPRLATVVLFGMALSLTIELLQHIFVLGAFQTDDIIWNTIGCLLGCI